jgi:ABC-type multidrug transport system ATPase subunit
MFSQKEVEDNIARLAERLKIKSRLSAFASNLSGGERRRVLIMRSLLSSCEMLIIDEPFAGLGWGDEVRAREVVRSSRERYRLILVISHSAELIWSLCNYIWIVNNGSRVAILSNSAPADNLPAMLSFEQADSLGVSNLIGARELADYIDSDDGLARFREQNATLGFWTSHSSLTDHRVEKHGGICGLLKSEKVLISRHFLRGERRVELRLRDQVACPPIVLRDQTSGASDNEAWVNIDTVISIK